LKENGVICRLQQHVKEMKSNGQLYVRHLAIHSWIFMLCSLEMFQQPRNQKNSDENMRGYKVLRCRLKRKDCFSDPGYELIEFWQHIMQTKAVKLQSAYFVLDHSEDKKKKNAERKTVGALVYFIGETDEDTMTLQRLHLAYMRLKEERESVFQQVCPELAELQRDGLSEVEDSERRLRRQAILRKKGSLVLDPRTAVEQRAFQKDEELQQYLCTSVDWCKPVGRFDNRWLESYVGGSWSFAAEKRKDPTKSNEKIWFERILDAQRKSLHIFYALQKKTTIPDESDHREANRTSNSPKPSSSFPMAHGSFPVAHGSFPMAHGSFPMAHGS